MEGQRDWKSTFRASYQSPFHSMPHSRVHRPGNVENVTRSQRGNAVNFNRRTSNYPGAFPSNREEASFAEEVAEIVVNRLRLHFMSYPEWFRAPRPPLETYNFFHSRRPTYSRSGPRREQNFSQPRFRRTPYAWDQKHFQNNFHTKENKKN